MKGLFAALLGAIFFLGLVFADAPEKDQYYESAFDGVWTGFATVGSGASAEKVFLSMNFNAIGSSGKGFVFSQNLEDDGTLITWILTMTKIKVKGKKLTFSFDGNEPEQGEPGYTPAIFDVKLRQKRGILKGTYMSTDPDFPKGKFELYPSDPEKLLQGLWTANLKSGGQPFPVILQPTQNSPAGGNAFIDGDLGKIRDGDFTNNIFTATVSAGETDFDLNLRLRKNKLRGTITGDTRVKAKLLPAGAKGKKVKIKSVSPNEVTAGVPFGLEPAAMAELTIRGKNFASGAMVHLDNPNIGVAAVTFKSAKEIRFVVDVPASVAEGTKVGLRVVNPDNQQAERANAFTVTGGDGGGGGPTVSFANDIQPVFTDNCAFISCHGGPNPKQGMNLSEGQAYSNIVDVASTDMPSLDRIEPGDPANSYLIRKIKGEGIRGSRMPLSRQPLPDATIARFETWVREGALNN